MKGSLLIHESLSNLYRPQKNISGTEDAVAFDVFRGKVFFSSEAFHQIIIKDNRVSKGKSGCQITLTSIPFDFPLGKID